MADNDQDVNNTAGQNKPGEPIVQELAASVGDGRDITRPFLGALMSVLPQDPVLLLRGNADYRLYEHVLLDDQVQSTFMQRRLAVTSREWTVTAGGDAPIDKEAAEWMQALIKTLRWRAICDKMLYGVFYGFAVGELLLAPEGSYVTVTDIKVRNRRRFSFSVSGELRLKTMSNLQGETMPPRKFWTFCTGSDHDDEPYGIGLAHWLYWPVFFKRNGMKSWLIFLEKFGMPTAKGEYPTGATSDQKQALLDALTSIAKDTAVIFPQGMTAGLIEAARSGTADYDTLCNKMDMATTKVVLGQTMTTEAAGGQYKGDIQMDVRQDIVKADGDLLSESWNMGPGTWLTQWNFPGAKVPILSCKVDEGEDQDKIAARYVDLAGVGFRPSLAMVQEDFGPEMMDIGMPASKPPAPVADFAENDQVDTLVDQGTSDWQPIMDPLLAPVRELIENAISIEDLKAKLAGAFHLMDTNKLIESLALEAFKARGAGNAKDAPT